MLDFTVAADRIVPGGINPGTDSVSHVMADNGNGIPTGSWIAKLDDPSGTSVAIGHGFPVSTSFAEALWGANAIAVSASYALEGVSDLSNLAAGGHFMASGLRLGAATRAGFSISESGTPDYSVPSAGRLMPHASAVSAGLTTELADGWSGGMTMSFLA